MVPETDVNSCYCFFPPTRLRPLLSIMLSVDDSICDHMTWLPRKFFNVKSEKPLSANCRPGRMSPLLPFRRYKLAIKLVKLLLRPSRINIVICLSVCLSVCLCVCICKLSKSSFSDDSAVCYVLSVLWTMGRNHQTRRYVPSSTPGGATGSEACYLRLPC